MSDNVFGKPVTEGTRSERALKALNDPNADGKHDDALAYVRKQKESFGNGVSVLCSFYNATGESLLFSQDESSYGKPYDDYPTRVQNGQWGAFLFIKKPVVPSGATAFVVYRGKYNDTDFCKQLMAWDVPWDQVLYNNHAYCNIYDDDGSDINKDDVYKNLEASARQHSAIQKGMFTTVTIQEGSSPLFEAQFTLEDVA